MINIHLEVEEIDTATHRNTMVINAQIRTGYNENAVQEETINKKIIIDEGEVEAEEEATMSEKTEEKMIWINLDSLTMETVQDTIRSHQLLDPGVGLDQRSFNLNKISNIAKTQLKF